MRFLKLSCAVCVVLAFPAYARRSSSILINPEAQPDLPTAHQANAAAAAASLNLSDIQGDILIGMKKQKELFFFFTITNSSTFRSSLRSFIFPLITTTAQLLSVSTQPVTAVNIAFSQAGLKALGVTDDLNDPFFSHGQFADAADLGDPGTDGWVQAFAKTETEEETESGIHGMLLLASDTLDNVKAELAHIQTNLTGCIQEVYRLQGQARPGPEQGHEHFGFMDGVSQPAIRGFTATPNPGQVLIDAGRILLSEPGDTTTRPSWAKDGTFLVFRQLQQMVPEFNKFLIDNPVLEAGLSPAQGSALMGARMVGRWKSGAPVDLAPLFDDPVLAADPQRNNNFTYVHPQEDNFSNQTRCPFSAHIRKTAPRGDFQPVNTASQIIRAGIPYGPEVSADEAASNTTSTERGLAFVCYQSSIGNGFHLIQQSWANNPNFMFNKNISTPGFDPIIGANAGQSRIVSGLDPTDATKEYTLLTDFVRPRGGEYFFTPALGTLRDVFGK